MKCPPGFRETTKKYTLFQILTDKIDPVEKKDFDAVIVDGGCLCFDLKFNNQDDKNFEKLCKYIEEEFKRCKRLDIVWDQHSKTSIKTATRKKRAENKGTEYDPNFSNNCGNDLSEKATKEDFSNSKELYMTFSEKVIYKGPNKSTFKECDHEEADTRMIVHVMNALKVYSCILVSANDADVLVILLSQYQYFIETNENAHIFMEYGKPKKIYDIKKIYEKQKDNAISLPMFHAISGCDTVYGLYGITKEKLWNTWQKELPNTTNIFERVFKNPFVKLDAEIIMQFVEKLYKKKTMDHSKKDLELNFLRAVYQASMWAISHKELMELPQKTDFGFDEDGIAQTSLDD